MRLGLPFTDTGSLVFFSVASAGCLRNLSPKPANVDLTLYHNTHWHTSGNENNELRQSSSSKQNHISILWAAFQHQPYINYIIECMKQKEKSNRKSITCSSIKQSSISDANEPTVASDFEYWPFSMETSSYLENIILGSLFVWNQIVFYLFPAKPRYCMHMIYAFLCTTQKMQQPVRQGNALHPLNSLRVSWKHPQYLGVSWKYPNP